MRILSGYILKEFFSYLIYILLAFIAIFILVDSVENLDHFIDEKVGVKITMLYYLFYLPYIVVLTMPVAMLLTTMFSLGRLVSDNEITAMKVSGVSLYRILLPLYMLALFVGLIVMLFAEYVVPKTTRFQEDIKNLGKEFRFSLSKNREMDRAKVFLANSDGSVVFARNYLSEENRANNVFIVTPHRYERAGESSTIEQLGIRRRLDAKFMLWQDGVWKLVDVEERTFTADGVLLTRHNSMTVPFVTVKPSDFARIDIRPEEMNYQQLRSYIRTIREKGHTASEWLVDLYMKISFPLVSFVIVFFGAPMVAGSSKYGRAASFGLALMICFVFYTLINASQILGRNGTLEPFVAAWLPNVIFLLVGIVMHVRASK